MVASQELRVGECRSRRRLLSREFLRTRRRGNGLVPRLRAGCHLSLSRACPRDLSVTLRLPLTKLATFDGIDRLQAEREPLTVNLFLPQQKKCVPRNTLLQLFTLHSALQRACLMPCRGECWSGSSTPSTVSSTTRAGQTIRPGR